MNLIIPNRSNTITNTKQPALKPIYSVRRDEAIGPMIEPKANAPVFIAETLFFILSMFKFFPLNIQFIAGTALLLIKAEAAPPINIPAKII